MFQRPGPSLVLAVAVSLAVGACAETRDATYATFADAQSTGAVARGWVPAWLPASATNIREVHNIDTNHFMLGFSVPKGTEAPLPGGCAQVGPRTPAKPPFQRDWWPADVPASALATHRHSLFKCDSYFFAYSGAQGEGFVWSVQ